MFGLLFLLFVTVPFIELYLLLEVGERIGTANTLIVIVVTGIVGAWAARQEGRRVLTNTMSQYQQGQMPADNMFQGLLIFMGGLLLITPGFFTDALGFSFIFPMTRWFWVKSIKAWFKNAVKSGSLKVHNIGPENHSNSPFEGFNEFSDEDLRKSGFKGGFYSAEFRTDGLQKKYEEKELRDVTPKVIDVKFKKEED